MKSFDLRAKFNIILLALALLGLVLSLFLAYEYAQPGEIVCPAVESINFDCQAVRESSYSKLLGVDLPIWGSLFYLGLIGSLAIYFFKTFREKVQKHYEAIVWFFIISGFIFESYLTYLQFAKIKALCSWCLMTYGLLILILIVNIVYSINKKLISRR
jgi:uncharacterized membrane protein